ncbi:conserved hypothetical protein [Leishmania major strain Friedlin]|uniref:Uncharacterized protein n=1 Tax=Leishmania major TaxID=5664 RepID=Q4QB28_LEIMA|nr:conserved hypothetical protein [Leishmania major strain Friedlin]CAG9574366.1 Rapamycin-insensitive_companion_of_mTOR_-_N-term/Rapamycin-insensitive_companion_of_mTOR_-_middle_domain/Rapamycin-insensitive_companion_of_mTOR_RasGEF_N_domain_containing_protein_-_putative [Leishmania major strain Friedlin]CAJ04835.1 conserved hypothetical protein [Leishmania major strain Friedlin]|eukprot:XP_001683470.1 conserved hypothetical protein [Leishmania major strain Friedlin]
MATAGMHKEALELLQQYAVDLKDFPKARERYTTVIEKELVPLAQEEDNADVLAATRAAREQVRAAWEEYIASVQQYFNRVVRSTIRDLLDPGSSFIPVSTVTFASETLLMTSSKDRSELNTGPLATATAVGSAESGRLLPSANSANVPAVGNSGGVGGDAVAQLSRRAERMSDFCAVCEKWYVNSEVLFELPEPQALAALAASALASVSRLLRLLGMRMAYVCAGNSLFLCRFIEDGEAVRWAAFCGDRGLNAEVDALLSLMERLMQLNIADPKAYPRVPFGWLYRLSSLLEHPDSVASASPKRRSVAVRIALQLLRHRPDQATAAGLHSVLLNACIEPNGCVTPDEAQQVVQTFLNLFDAPSTRQYLKPTDLRTIFAPFLSTAKSGGTDLLTMQNNAKELIVTIFSNCVGSLWISSEVTELRSIIDVLHLPGSLDTKMVIITLFNELLTRLAPHRGIVPMDTWKGFEEDRLRKAARDAEEQAMEANDSGGDVCNDTQYLNNNSFMCDLALTDATGDAALFDDFIPTTKALGYHVMDPLLGRVLVCLNYHGLPYALTQLMQNVNKNRVVTTAASSLLQDIFVLMDTVLPQVIVFKLHEAFNKAVGRLANDGSLFVGGLTSQLFRSYKKNSGIGGGASMIPTSTTQMPNTTLNTPGTLDVDDPTFATMLRDCKVDRMKGCQMWNFDILVTLVQGPLHLSRRFRAARELMESLVLFFTPSSHSSTPQICSTFSTQPPDTVSPQMCMVGVELIDLILSSRDGAALLEHMGFVAAVAAMLKEVRIGKPVILRRAVVNTCIGRSLLRITGRLSAHANGLLLMRDHGIFSLVDSMFSKLKGPRLESPTEEDTLQDVCYQLLQYLYLGAVPNYGVCKDIRQTFRAALGNPSNTIRLCAAQQLKKAVWRDLSTSMKWGIETLLQALHDDFFSVIESAFKLLLSICLCSDEGLDYLIECFPTVLMESEMILSHAKQLRLNVLLYRIASRPSGFRFLQCYGWLEKELRRWEESESVRYTIMLERLQSYDDSAAVAGGPGGAGGVLMSSTSDPSCRHAHSYSDTLGGMYGRMTGNTAYLPLLTTTDASSTKFFPVHFASVLCSSVEGCAMFKHSKLWTRSVQRLLEQPLPPDIVYDDSLSDEDDLLSENSSDGEFGLTTDAARYMRQQQQSQQRQQQVHPSTNTAYCSGGVGGASVPALGALASSSSVPRYSVAGDGPGNSLSVARVRDGLRGGPGTSLGSNNAGGGVNGNTSTAAANGSGGFCGFGVADQSSIATAKEIETLKKGYLSAPSSKIISASRFCKSSGQSFSLDCVGDIVALKDAILCVAEVGSTEVGYGMLLSVPGLQRRFIALSRFASTISVRCMGLLGSAILARSRRGGDDLVKKGYSVLLNPNAYVSAEGIPYSVSFAQMKPSKWVSIACMAAPNNTTARHAHADSIAPPNTQEVPQRILENLYALSNPVSCENAKKTLYKIMKRKPQLFLQPQVRRLCLEISFTYRMHYKERRFLADLLENAQLTDRTPTDPKPPRMQALRPSS